MFYLDLFRALDQEQVRYLLIGGLALNIHGVERATMDIDLLLAMDSDNLQSFMRAAQQLQLRPLLPVSLESLADPAQLQRWAEEKHMLAFALRPPEPSAPTVDILIQPKIDFGQAWQRRIEKIFGNDHVQLAHIDDLIALKTGTGRQRDQSDITALERLKQLGAT
jgi:hypothetical protein